MRTGGNRRSVLRVQAQDVTPILNVSDLEASLGWFAKLGWEEAFRWPDGDEPSFGGVCSGECRIFLCLDGQGGRGRGENATTAGPGDAQRGDKGAWIAIAVEDADAVEARARAAGLEVTMPAEDMPWGIRELHVRHPDGHVLRIGHPLEAGEESV
jgi:uncharacterized glyoxalase superfamily protein PhnB